LGGASRWWLRLDEVGWSSSLVTVNLETVDTERLRLERWGDRHTGALVAMNREPEVVRFLTGGVLLSEDASRAQSVRIAEHWERFGFGLWAVVDRASGVTAGFTGLSHPLWFPAEAEFVEVGWRLHPDAWGRGFATEAGFAALDIGFGALGLDRIVSYIHIDNAPSRAVSQRLGMELERTIDHPTNPHRLDVFTARRPG
jgi:RimJ/RimL family protein N-acetyltransferase